MSSSLSNKSFSIKWVEKKVSSLPMFISIPDTGLVSLLTAINIVNQANMPMIGYVDAPWLPPIVSIVEGIPLPPVRIYASDKLTIFVSEVPIPPESWHNLSELILSLHNELNVTLSIGATGLPNQKRHSLEKLRLFVSYTDKSLKERFFKDALDFSGLFAGPYATILKFLFTEMKPAVLLIVDSFPNYPDPEAAALVSETIGKIVGETFDVSMLLQKASQIKLMARKLAAETQRLQSEVTTKTGQPAASFYL